MPLDIATPFDAAREAVEQAVQQTYQWAKRCKAEHEKPPPSLPLSGEGLLSPPDRGDSGGSSVLYGIVQGGLFPELREKAAKQLTELDFFGYSVGGELRDKTGSRMEEGVLMTTPHLPADKPRYLMGAGSPADIVRAVRGGIDQFDCVLPIRDARHGRLYRNLNQEELAACLHDPERPVDPATLHDTIDIMKSSFARDWSPFAPGNPAIAKPYTMGYVHHLLRVEPPSGYRLAVLNNIHFYVQLMQAIRATISTHGHR